MAKKKNKPRSLLVALSEKGEPKVVRRITRKEAMEKADMYLLKNLPKYLKHLHALAVGIKTRRVTGDGKEVVYDVAPDRQALEYLLERGMGKIPQKMELTGEDGGGVKIIPWMPMSALPALNKGEIIDGTARVINVPEASSALVRSEGEVEEGEDEEEGSEAGGEQTDEAD